MTPTGIAMETALSELKQAISGLENAVDMRIERQREQGDIESEVRRVHADRSKLAQELEYRICLSATISNALFGLTDTPGTMADRMRQLAGAVVDLLRSPDQVIRVGVFVRGCCPVGLREDVLRSAHELIGNAVKHGMRGRPHGRIAVRLTSDADCTTLTVLDNGWGFAGKPRSGEGLALTRDFAARHGGSLTIDGMEGTAATLELPH